MDDTNATNLLPSTDNVLSAARIVEPPKEGWCPLGDLHCPGAELGEGKFFTCGFQDLPGGAEQVRRCQERLG